MSESFDKKKAKEFLSKKDTEKKELDEQERIETLDKVTSILQKDFSDTQIEIFLVGSILKPYQFHRNSDIDIVVKNYKGDRFELWTHLEQGMNRRVEIIIFEKCHFKEYVEKEGLKVV